MPQKTALFLKIIFQVLLITLVSKLPLSPNIFTESKIASYYDNNAVSKDLNFQHSETSPEKILSILKGLNPSKAAGIGNSSGKFLALTLVTPVLPTYYVVFLNDLF